MQMINARRVALKIAAALFAPMAIQTAFVWPWLNYPYPDAPSYMNNGVPMLAGSGVGLIFIAWMYREIRLFVLPPAILYAPGMFLFLLWFTWLLIVLTGGSVP